MIPEHTKDSIDLYVSHGCEPGSFLMAVLTNDLFGAVGRADEFNIRHLREICQYVYNDIPSVCWGSDEKVKKWMLQKREEKNK